MKKLMIIILVLAILVPAASSADSMTGIWAVWVPQSVTIGSGNYSFICILNEDNTFFYIFSASRDGETTTSTDTGTWEFNNDNVILQKKDENKYMIIPYEDGMLWVNPGGDVIKFGLKKIPDFELTQMVYVGK